MNKEMKATIVGIIGSLIVGIILIIFQFMFDWVGMLSNKDTEGPTFSIDNQVIEVMELEAISWTDYIYDIQDNMSKTFSKKLISDGVNYNVIGEYPVTVEVADESNNKTRKSITVTVTDTIPPVLIVNDITLEVNQYSEYNWVSAIAECYDNSGISPTIEVDDDLVNFEEIGRYSVIVEATDSKENSVQKIINVNVVDTTEPNVIYENLQVESGDYEDYDWINLIKSVEDNYDLECDCDIQVISNNVVFDSPGNYIVNVEVTDTNNNTNYLEIPIEVIDTTSPSFEVNVPVLESGSDIDLLDYVYNITDNSREEISFTIEIISFDICVPSNEYSIRYIGADTSDNEYIVVANIEVIDTLSPEMDVVIPNIEVGYPGIIDFSQYITRINDNSSSTNFDITINSSSIDLNSIGIYQVEYTISDEYGNSTVENHVLNIIDSTLPVANINNTEYMSEGFVPNISMFNYLDITEKNIFKIDSYYFNKEDRLGYIVVYSEDIIGNYSYTLFDITSIGNNLTVSKRIQNLYFINSTSDFEKINNDLSGFYVLETSISLLDNNWVPIAFNSAFTGVLYGKNGTDVCIFGLSTTQSYLENINFGIFDTLDGAIIGNINFVNPINNFTYLSGEVNFGVISGIVENSFINSVSITNSHNTLNGNGDVNYGTMFGVVNDSYIVNCSSEDWNVIITTGNINIGSLVGVTSNSYYNNINVIVNMGTNVSSSDSEDRVNMGGVFGKSYNDTIEGAISSGIIDLNFDYNVMASVGGIAGSLQNSTLVSSYSTATVNGENYLGEINGGGLVGYIYQTTIQESYATGNVTLLVETNHDANGGGLIGKANYNSIIRNVYSMGDVVCESSDNYGNTRCGGVVGYLKESTLEYAIGYGSVESISPNDFAFGGGIVGYAKDSELSYLLALGYVTVDGDDGGFLNSPDGYSGRIVSSFDGCAYSNLYSSSHQIEIAENMERDVSILTIVTISSLSEIWYTSSLALDNEIWNIDEISYTQIGNYTAYPLIYSTEE
ncbi:hypothetical protein ACAG96_07185 [Candidatus Izemoplasma sp. B36]|uniref:hypothetical protein n=1 Tax=Candidatus Izemoplasma sp. B36 TaxID=3242468 RepID=UPI003556F716